MKNYRRLNKKSERNLRLCLKLAKALKKSFKWWSVFVFIAVVFSAGMVALFMTLDEISLCRSADPLIAVSSPRFTVEKTQKKLDENSIGEIERESQRNNLIADEAAKHKEDYEFEEKPYDFGEWNISCDPNLIIVNKHNPVPESFKIKTKLCRGKEVSPSMFAALEEMIVSARESGIVLWISSAYRNFQIQEELFKKRVEAEGEKEVLNKEEAERRAGKIVAKPGESEHITGLAVDLNGVEQNFYSTKEYKWLMDNAHSFGFIERYQKKWSGYTGILFEPWHFRFVGKEYAPKIKESNLSLEQYIIRAYP